ncbi:MAG: cytochrome c oxidase subunit II [Burkholderiaceae bacterium]
MTALAVEDMPGGPAVNQLNLAEPATTIAAGQHDIHNLLLWVCLAIFVVVFAVMFYSVFAHRKSKGAKSADFHESTAVEILWTVVPFIIVVGLGAVATGEVISQKDTSNADVTIKATGYQWKWGYDYVKGEGEGISFLSTLTTPEAQIRGTEEKSVTYLTEVDNVLVVPVNKKVRMIVTANDVIHSWYIPAFGVKQDAIPGFVRDLWFKSEKVGTFRGYCTELCGKNHAFMPIVVEVKSQADYATWVAEKQAELLALADDPNKTWEAAELTARGEKVYASNCAACHQATGKGVPGAFPALAGSAKVTGPAAAQIDLLLKGVSGTAMASFKQLSDVELAAVMTYTRNAWGNQSEEAVVQPKQFQDAR